MKKTISMFALITTVGLVAATSAWADDGSPAPTGSPEAAPRVLKSQLVPYSSQTRYHAVTGAELSTDVQADLEYMSTAHVSIAAVLHDTSDGSNLVLAVPTRNPRGGRLGTRTVVLTFDHVEDARIAKSLLEGEIAYSLYFEGWDDASMRPVTIDSDDIKIAAAGQIRSLEDYIALIRRDRAALNGDRGFLGTLID